MNKMDGRMNGRMGGQMDCIHGLYTNRVVIPTIPALQRMMCRNIAHTRSAVAAGP